MGIIKRALAEQQDGLIAFAQELVRTKSMTCHEENMAKAVSLKMKALGYEEVTTDRSGNVLGRIGSGPCSIFFDSHMDTVDVIDSAEWTHDPFGAVIEDGKMYGRGTADMKCALAATVYAGALAGKLGLLEGKTVYVSASVMEEDYDGEGVLMLLTDSGIRPDYAVVCEPTGLLVANAHHGRALVKVTIYGKAAHGSNPQLGDNPAYKLSAVTDRVKTLNDRLMADEERGTIALTRIGCSAASNNSISESVYFYLDRRLGLSEDMSTIEEEMSLLLEGVSASWEIVTLADRTWTGRPFSFSSYLPSWSTGEDNPLVVSALAAAAEERGKQEKLIKPNYCTNAVTTAGKLKIPTIVLGPGAIEQAHTRDEFCPVADLVSAAAIYTDLISRIYTI